MLVTSSGMPQVYTVKVRFIGGALTLELVSALVFVDGLICPRAPRFRAENAPVLVLT